MNANAPYLYLMVANPYFWLFCSALFLAMVLARATTRIKRNIYAYTVRRRHWRTLLLMGSLSGLSAWFGLGVVGTHFVYGSTPLWLYYVTILLVVFLLIRFVPYSGYLILLLILFSGYTSHVVNRQWTLVSYRSFEREPVLGIYHYDLMEQRADLVVMHRPTEVLDRAELARNWHEMGLVANVAFSYASYPKCPVNYRVRGYLLESRPEIFFVYPARYFYPLDFTIFNSSSNVAEDPHLFWYLTLLKPILGLRTVEWELEGTFVSEETPMLFYPSTLRHTVAPLESDLPEPCRFYADGDND
ncbi:hypothetical protein [Entomospira culicis]|nr:hypothetical protein [Entomospira culicis]WDI37580.1 hypothetical protein PVA46_01990 [Entomospira culicis]